MLHTIIKFSNFSDFNEANLLRELEGRENDIDQCPHSFFIEITGFPLRAIFEFSNLSDFNKENLLKSVISTIFCPFLVDLCEERGPNGL